MLPKKTPLRKCVGCNEMKPKRTLVRIVKNKEALICLDRTGKLPGRGAYLCDCHACLLTAKKNRALERALSSRIPDEVYLRLEKELEHEQNSI